MCFWRPVGVRAGEVGAPLEFTSGSSWAGKGRRGTAAALSEIQWLEVTDAPDRIVEGFASSWKAW